MVKVAKEMLRWLYWYPLRWTVQKLSLPALYALCRPLASLMATVSPRAGAVAKELQLLQKSHGPKEIQKALFVWVCNELEVLYFPKMNKENMTKTIAYRGMENLDRALAQKKGVVLLFAHFGANQMIMPALGYQGYKINQIAAPPPLIWGKLMKGHRTYMQKKGMALRWELEQTLPAEFIDPFGSLKNAFKCLKRNEILALTMDGGAGARHVTTGFFGRKTAFPVGSVDLAIRNGCPALPVFMIRGKNGFNRLVIEPPVEFIHSDNRDEIVKDAMAKCIRRLEWYTQAHPDHYVNFLSLKRLLSQIE